MRDFWSKCLQFSQYVGYLHTGAGEPMWYGMQILKTSRSGRYGGDI